MAFPEHGHFGQGGRTDPFRPDPYTNPYAYRGRAAGGRSAGVLGVVILVVIAGLIAFSWLAA